MHDRKAYRLEPVPFSQGGQAHLFHATRKSDGHRVVLKRRISEGMNARTRMRREVEVQRKLAESTRYVMPIIDWDERRFEWYVMPLGNRSMLDLPCPVHNELLREIVESVLQALAVAQVQDHPHRDLSPGNIIEVPADDAGSWWVLADWGVTRRPIGETTSALTKVGLMIGKEGYAYPLHGPV